MDKRILTVIITLIISLALVGIFLAMFFGRWGFFEKYKSIKPNNSFTIKDVTNPQGTKLLSKPAFSKYLNSLTDTNLEEYEMI
jgi:ABC-type phosphate transport system permease subunit